ncbi:MAG TPA: SulP family inorganic anion transporter [Candidatus Limnocylindrales bacterium]|nr:SulP family inorganic anion transporter [Candidatus Limnocylindrales bacterium]
MNIDATTVLQPVDAIVSRIRAMGPRRRSVVPEAMAGLPVAISCVPDGMAGSILAGVSPIHGLYANFAGPILGGLSADTRRMVVATTSASALAVGSALVSVPAEQRADAVVLLTLMAGGLMILAGVLRLGRYTRFVSHSVMTGFLTGIAANIILGQIPDLTGVSAPSGPAITKTFYVLTNPGLIDLPSLLAGLAAIVLIVLLAASKLSTVAGLVALAIPTAVVLLLNVVSIEQVSDLGAIPTGFPLPQVPDLSVFSLELVIGALTVAAIVLIQGAGVAESAPNPDGRRSLVNRDFIAQGVGNLAAGLFRGQPVGGSVGQTALNTGAGAQTRWAAIFAGLWMLAILVLFSGLVGLVALPTLAGVLIVAGFGSFRIPAILTVVRTGALSEVAFGTTLVATLLLPVAVAVGVGVALSLMLQLNREALDLRVVQLVPQPDGGLLEQPAPKRVKDDSITALDVYGSLYYAGARTLQARLPQIRDARRPVVIIRLRGRTSLGSTSLTVLSSYGDRLAEAGGRLYLSGVDADLAALFRKTRTVTQAEDSVQLFEATPIIGESSRQAFEAAEKFLAAGARSD